MSELLEEIIPVIDTTQTGTACIVNKACSLNCSYKSRIVNYRQSIQPHYSTAPRPIGTCQTTSLQGPNTTSSHCNPEPQPYKPSQTSYLLLPVQQPYGSYTTMTRPDASLDAASIANGEKNIAERPLQEVCAEVSGRINAFLESDVPEGILKDVQNQTKTALGVIEECLERYR